MVANASKEEAMTGKLKRLASRVPDVAGNGLIDRRALLGRGILFAGAAATGTGGSLPGGPHAPPLGGPTPAATSSSAAPAGVAASFPRARQQRGPAARPPAPPPSRCRSIHGPPF